MTRQLTRATTLVNLKKEARRWLNALRANNQPARARLDRALPNAPAEPGLRHIHHALAREFGLDGWTALRHALAASPTAPPDPAAVALFLQYATPDWRVAGPDQHARSRNAAGRVLDRHPEIARDSIYTAAVCGHLAEVERRIAEQPASATQKGGPRYWEPLLYVCYGRVPTPAAAENAVAIARLLLHHGADPNAFFWAGTPNQSAPGARYTALCGVAGEGEEDALPHPHKQALADLLLESGAEPYDIQLFYNTHFHGDIVWLLDPIYRHSVRRGRQADWDDPQWQMIDMGAYDFGARFFLGNAVSRNKLAVAEWLLRHGAGPNAVRKPDSKFPQRGLHEEALRLGLLEMAGLLVRFGSTPSGYVRDGVEAFHDACLRLDRTAAQAMLQLHPEYLLDPRAMMHAATHDLVDVMALLLNLGMSPDLEDSTQGNQRPLHAAALADSLRVAALLIDRGAEIDPVENQWHGTPISLAIYVRKARMIQLLGRYTRQIFALTVTGNIERLREILAVEPELARFTEQGGYTPLMRLPDDEARALEIVDLLVAAGADPAALSPEGKTAADYAGRRGQQQAATRLRAAARQSDPPAPPSLQPYRKLAEDLVAAYRLGDEAALQRLRDLSPDSQLPAEISLHQARFLIARSHQFHNWQALVDQVQSSAPDQPILARPVRLFHIRKHDAVQDAAAPRDWDTALAQLRDHRIPGLDAQGQMTDALIERFSHFDHITSLRLAGSRQLTDAGLRYLARLPQLQHLDLSSCAITDRGLQVLRHLPNLRTLHLYWQSGISDAGIANLRDCARLERVDLMGTPTGDAAIQALTGKPNLRHIKPGRNITDAGIALFQHFPAFRTWQGGEPEPYNLMDFDPGPTYIGLVFAESFTDRGVATLATLEGLAALNVGGGPGVTATGIEAIAALPHLSWLGCTNHTCTDAAMRPIAAMTRLRMLMCQDAVAGDDGFAALSHSQSIEIVWGRRCHNLRSRGFAAFTAMPALRSLSVSCKNVDDQGLSALPRFPALRELMPMDVPDEGYRHIGRSRDLESLILMYCRDTTDRATEHIAGLTKLKSYSASMTRITDRTLEILARMPSLERIDIGRCPAITDAGIAFLAQLPHLREIELSGLPRVTAAGTAVFSTRVRVKFSV